MSQKDNSKALVEAYKAMTLKLEELLALNRTYVDFYASECERKDKEIQKYKAELKSKFGIDI